MEKNEGHSSGQMLMLYRSNPLNAGLWNGLGDKFESGEAPLGNIHREVMEEAGVRWCRNLLLTRKYSKEEVQAQNN